MLALLQLSHLTAQLEDLLLKPLIAHLQCAVFLGCKRGRQPSRLGSRLPPQGGAGATAPEGVSAAWAAPRGARPLRRLVRALRGAHILLVP